MDTAKIIRIASFGLMAIGLVMLVNVFINVDQLLDPSSNWATSAPSLQWWLQLYFPS